MRVRSVLLVVAMGAGLLAGAPPGPAAALGAVPTAIAVEGQSCIRLSDHTIRCWGYNGNGQIGDGTTANRPSPFTVPGITDATAIATGGGHTCAVVTAGAVKCWGYNQFGQLGNGNGTQSPTPVSVTGLTGATQLALGYNHSCALVGGAVKCWGNNSNGQLGNGAGGPGQSSFAVVSVTGIADATEIESGGDFSCAIVTGGAVKCWGFNVYGEAAGDGTHGDSKLTPVTVTGLTGVTDLGLGDHNTCVVASGAVECWGSNASGQLGDGSQTDRYTPVASSGLTGVVDVSSGKDLIDAKNHTCAVLATGAMKCWGKNDDGQVGDGTQTMRLVPTTVANVTGATAVASGLDYSCALVHDGYIECWGFNGAYRLGDSSTTTRITPVYVTGYGPATFPSAPTIGVAKAGLGKARLSWTAPNDGGSPITGYTVTPYYGGAFAEVPQTFNDTATTHVITNLSNGVAYTFKVAAINAVDTGPQSAASNSVTPLASYPFATNTALIDRVWTDMTAKAPTSAELNTWLGPLNTKTKTRGDLEEALRRSPDNVNSVDPTARLYRAFLGRAPDAGGLKFWIGRKRAGTWTVSKMAESFTASNEFKTKYGSFTNRQFVTRIYTDVLGRTANTSGVDYWTKKLDTKAKTKAQVMVGFSESNEYKTKQAQNTDVAIAYIFLMGRSPTTAEASDWVTREKAGTTNAALALELLTGDPYATHITG